jgi:hypothetical protein
MGPIEKRNFIENRAHRVKVKGKFIENRAHR